MNRMRNLAGAAVAAVSASSTSHPNLSFPPPSTVSIIVSVLATGQSRVDWQPARELNCPRRGGARKECRRRSKLSESLQWGLARRDIDSWRGEGRGRGRQGLGGRWRWRAGVVYADGMKLADARRVTRIDQTLNITEQRHTHTHPHTYIHTHTHTHTHKQTRKHNKCLCKMVAPAGRWLSRNPTGLCANKRKHSL